MPILTTGAGAFPIIGGGGGGAAVTWDPSHTAAAITLSSDKLTASVASLPDSTNYNSRATAGIGASSKVYWEVLGNTVPSFSNALGLGFADSTFTIPQDNYLGSGTSTLGYYNNGSVYHGGGSIATLPAYIDTDVVCFALDTVNSKIWMRVIHAGASLGWNGNVIGSEDPATNTGGLSITATPTIYPALVYRADASDAYSVTGQFSSASWSFSKPAGFTNL